MAKKQSIAATPTPPLKKSTLSTGEKTQKTLHGFFQKTPNSTASNATLPERPSPTKRANGSLQSKMFARASSSQLTPVPSSDGPEEYNATPALNKAKASRASQTTSLPSPVTSANGEEQNNGETEGLTALGTPSRKVRHSQSRQI
jgi:hypothetical protein